MLLQCDDNFSGVCYSKRGFVVVRQVEKCLEQQFRMSHKKQTEAPYGNLTIHPVPIPAKWRGTASGPLS